MIHLDSDEEILHGFMAIRRIAAHELERIFPASYGARCAVAPPTSGVGIWRERWAYTIVCQVANAPLCTAYDGSQHKPFFRVNLMMQECEKQCETWESFYELVSAVLVANMETLKEQVDEARATVN